MTIVRNSCPVILALVLGLLNAQAGPPDDATKSPPAPAEFPLSATQVTLRTENMACQGTVVGFEQASSILTVVSAAHGLFPGRTGAPIVIRPAGGGVSLRGRIETFAANPAYKLLRSRDPHAQNPYAGAIGADNSVATVKVFAEDERERAALRAIRPAPVTEQPVPSRTGVSVLTVHVVDRTGVEHTVKAGNSMNPKWLGWGPLYRPSPGDSGAGVFVVRTGPKGEPEPLLIGNVVASDNGGGIASLFSRRELPSLAAPAGPAAEPK